MPGEEGNACLRSCSTMFFVWTHQRSGADAYEDIDFRRGTCTLVADRPDTVFLVKMAYRLER